LLLKAEAHARLEEYDEALPLLNMVRNRAGLESFDQQEAEDEYGSVVDAIMHERFIELSFEGHRWFDLVRTDRAIEVMGPITGLSDERNILWPLHENTLNRNPELDQNDFYK